jgi:hypothetical protein
MKFRITLSVFCVTLAAAALCQDSDLHELIGRYQSDWGSLDRYFPVEGSSARTQRLDRLCVDYQRQLSELEFKSLPPEARADYVLFSNTLQQRRSSLATDQKVQTQLDSIMPFSSDILTLAESQTKMDPLDPAKTARTVTDLTLKIRDADAKLPGKGDSVRNYGNSGLSRIRDLRRAFERWNEFYTGYDPLFSWWVKAPYAEAHAALDQFEKDLVNQTTGGRSDAIVGRPIGRDALLEQLKYEMIPYTPEELVTLAEQEYAWCLVEMKKASREMGYGDDWKAALEKVKQSYVEPGKQPELIKALALEAIDFVEKKDLVTVPALAKETWRMEMMSPERQLIAPFFLGGEVIQVSYPTDTMTEDQKLMSMRGNNPYFAHATAFHELIPGHHLQGFMEDRYRNYRNLFWTPFMTEGWALYWEMLMWDLGFHKTPEQKVGALFWRMHRCMRIVFSLNFHLGNLTPQQCVDILVDRVGHERANAEGEVRRSLMGGYGPLYQAAYMLGGLQLRAMHKEFVDSGKMTNKQFHDAILHEGNIPIAMQREIMMGGPTKTEPPQWRFRER